MAHMAQHDASWMMENINLICSRRRWSSPIGSTSLATQASTWVHRKGSRNRMTSWKFLHLSHVSQHAKVLGNIVTSSSAITSSAHIWQVALHLVAASQATMGSKWSSPPDKDFLRQTWFSYKYVSFPFLLFPFGRIKVAQRTAKYIVGRSICPTIWDILYLHRTNYSPFDQSPKLCSTIDLFPVFQMAIVIIVCFRWTPSKNKCSSKISNALPWQTLLPNCSCSWFHQKATEMTCQGVQPWKSMEQHGTLKNAWGDVSEVSDGSARCLHRGLERPSSSGDPNADITSEGLLLFDQIKDIKGETPACALLITLSSLLADSNPRFYTCQASHTRICLELLEDSAGCMILRCACMCMLRLRMIN